MVYGSHISHTLHRMKMAHMAAAAGSASSGSARHMARLGSTESSPVVPERGRGNGGWDPTAVQNGRGVRHECGE